MYGDYKGERIMKGKAKGVTIVTCTIRNNKKVF